MGKTMIDKHLGFACQSEGSKRGFTLMELMVYIAIMGIVVIVAGQAFSNSAKSRIRTQSMLQASEVAENVASLFKTDVAQTGAKSSMEARGANGGDDTFSNVYSDVYMNPDGADDLKDLSSFKFVPEHPSSDENLQEFVMRRVRYDDDGKFEAVEEVTWKLVNKSLMRYCVIVGAGTATDDCAASGTSSAALLEDAVEIATDVEVFQVLPAIPWHKDDATAGEDEYLVFPDATGEFRFVPRYDASKGILPIETPAGGKSVTLSGFSSNYKEGTDAEPTPQLDKDYYELYAFNNGSSSAGWNSLCEANPIPLNADQTYELSFGINPASGSEKALMAFIPNKDHMAVGFRDVEGKKIPGMDDFAFFPPLDTAAKSIERRMRFSVGHTDVNACLVFTFSFYSPVVASAKFDITNLQLRVIGAATYEFDKDVTYVAPKYKKDVKAFRLRLQVKRNGESGETTLIIPTPSNGPTD